tara:strand:+ start:5560 stop:5832 length:273 start_codon:yes stop_codon:yes gene_type:complete
MILIIKILVGIYVMLGVIYFLATGKKNLLYSIKYSQSIPAKIYSVFWFIGFSLFMGGFLVFKKCVLVGRRFVGMYKAYLTIKKLNKKLKK